jgi:hypothetical protein
VTLPAAREYAVEDDRHRGELPQTFLKTKRRVYCVETNLLVHHGFPGNATVPDHLTQLTFFGMRI